MSRTPAALADPGRLLAAWEAAAAAPPSVRGAVLAGSCGAVESVDAALDLPLAAQADLLARLYGESFSQDVEGSLTCAACGAVAEVRLPLSAFAAADDGSDGRRRSVALPGGGAAVVRALTARDLLEAAGADDPARTLVERSVTDAEGLPLDPAGLDEAARTDVDAAAESLAGGAALVLRAVCPGCGADVVAPADVGVLLWDRVAALAPIVLAEVAELATAFGWSQAEVLSLSALRRAAYLELARGGRR